MASKSIRWRDVVGYTGLYEVSRDGRVRRVGRACGARPGRFLSLTAGSNGYPTANLYRDNIRFCVTAHSLVAAAFIGPRPDGLQVNHKNGDRTDNRVENLEYTTCAGNNLHRYRVLNRNGHQTKLSAADVMDIRAATGGRGLNIVLARKYGVTDSLVSMIRSGKRRVHIAA